MMVYRARRRAQGASRTASCELEFYRDDLHTLMPSVSARGPRRALWAPARTLVVCQYTHRRKTVTGRHVLMRNVGTPYSQKMHRVTICSSGARLCGPRQPCATTYATPLLMGACFLGRALCPRPLHGRDQTTPSTANFALHLRQISRPARPCGRLGDIPDSAHSFGNWTR